MSRRRREFYSVVGQRTRGRRGGTGRPESKRFKVEKVDFNFGAVLKVPGVLLDILPDAACFSAIDPLMVLSPALRWKRITNVSVESS